MINTYVKRYIPMPVRQFKRRCSIAKTRRRNATLHAATVFDTIYREQKWGGIEHDFYSGSGSEPAYAAPYAEIVSKYIGQFENPRVVDIGCGDFRVAQRFVSPEIQYVGIDLAEDLIARNNLLFSASHIAFVTQDACLGGLPSAEIVTIRQVLQLLSNAQIAAILEAINHIPIKIITEAYPVHPKLPRMNIDKSHGSDTRITDGYAVYLDLPPFSLPYASMQLELSTDDGYVIRTFVIDHRPPAIKR